MQRNAAEYTIIFDGGSRGNPGEGYGSYQLRTRTAQQIVRLTFGDNITNNEAEYGTLIAALKDVVARIIAEGRDPQSSSLAVRGDSQLVIYQVTGKWKVKTPHIRTLHRDATTLLNRFGATDIQWQPRAKSVHTLGH